MGNYFSGRVRLLIDTASHMPPAAVIRTDIKARIIRIILRDNGNFTEIGNAIALASTGGYICFWKTFQLPVLWGFAACILGLTQATVVIYNLQKPRQNLAFLSIFIWVTLVAYIRMSSSEALSIPMMSSAAFVNLLNLMFCHYRGGREGE